jgi:hypothetical protein
MKPVPVRLYWVAVASNALALGILLRGTISPLGSQERVIAILLSALSMCCWIAYFGTSSNE